MNTGPLGVSLGFLGLPGHWWWILRVLWAVRWSRLNGIEIWGIWGLGQYFLPFVAFLGPLLRRFHGPTVFGFYPYEF